MKYITRFAPSPTGLLHIGGVRTAIFDYLAARSTGGKFLLRIEDTDRERFVEGATEYIHEGLKWLGIINDGEVVSQSERLPIYQKNADRLVSENMAYKCFCTKERLDSLREEQEKAGKPPVYDRHCCKLTESEISEKEKTEKYVIRFKIPTTPTEVSWTDKVKGKISISTKTLEDFIIIKSDGWPTYNFANVVDDHELDITLVIRGDEFVPSTPKHILLYQALDFTPPEFAHVPVIVGPDMKKLSKRNGDVALLEYKEKGYLPEALLNFLVLLGWNPGTKEEIFSLPELEKIFSVERIGKSPAIFDIERLNWINGLYIRNLSVADLTKKLMDFNPALKNIESNFLKRIVEVEQSRLKTLAEFQEITAFYLNLAKYPGDMLVFKKSSLEATRKGLEAILAIILEINEKKWSEMSSEEFNFLLAQIVANNILNNADVYWPVRVALSGLEKSPSPAELLWVLGKTKSTSRIENALAKLK